LLRLKMKPDQVGEQLEHADGLRVVETSRTGVDRAQGAEKALIRNAYRNGYVALEPVSLRGVMFPERRVARDLIDHHQLAALTNLVADRALDFELAPGHQTEIDFVAY